MPAAGTAYEVLVGIVAQLIRSPGQGPGQGTPFFPSTISTWPYHSIPELPDHRVEEHLSWAALPCAWLDTKAQEQVGKVGTEKG